MNNLKLIIKLEPDQATDKQVDQIIYKLVIK